MQKNEQKNDALYKKYTNFTRKDLMFSNFVQTNIAGAIALFFIGNVSWMFLQSTPDTMLCRAKNKIYMPYKKAIHDAYIPVERYIVDDNTYKTGELQVNPNPGFRAHGTWLANLLLSLWWLYVTACYFKRTKMDLDTIDMMSELKELQGKHRLSDTQVAKLVAASGEIIGRMSAEERVYFDMLSSGKINIKDDKVFTDMAVAILDGYLRTHAAETENVLKIYKNNNDITTGLKKAIGYKMK